MKDKVGKVKTFKPTRPPEDLVMGTSSDIEPLHNSFYIRNKPLNESN